ncbi:ankyrin repeat-containing domain protein [Mycena capillaripes]|nr:ankyrin repeat-containing domain protein [Mycena capillaripes]
MYHLRKISGQTWGLLTSQSEVDRLRAALALACTYGILEDVSQILQYWDELPPGKQPLQAFQPQLHLAAENGHGEIVHLLLSRGITMNDSTVKAAFAAERILAGSSIPVFQAFNDASNWGINDPISIGGGTPLQMAVWCSHMELAQWILDHGADVNDHALFFGWTTLATACRDSSLAMVELLLDNGATISDSGAMYGAAGNGRVDVLALLLDRGADINETPTNSWIRREPRISTPLHAALQNQHRTVVKFLLDRGADTSIKNVDGKSVLQAAQENELVDWLEQGE